VTLERHTLGVVYCGGLR